jgi:hypothetical protein
MTHHVYNNPAKVTVETGGGLGGLVLMLLPVLCGGLILAAIAEWVVAYAVVLGSGAVVACAVVSAEVWVLHRYCTKITWRQGVRAFRPAAVRATVTRLSAEDRRVLEQVRELLALAAMPDTRPVQAPYVITDAAQRQREVR